MAGGLVKTTLQAVGSTGLNLGDVMNVGFAVHDYNYAREQGNSKGVSVAKAATSFAWGEFFYGGIGRAVNTGVAKVGLKGVAGAVVGTAATLGITAAMAGVHLGAAMGNYTAETMGKAYDSNGYLGSGHFNMTQAGYTMRQRSLNAIRSNGLNTQSVLGNEARTYFRSTL